MSGNAPRLTRRGVLAAGASAALLGTGLPALAAVAGMKPDGRLRGGVAVLRRARRAGLRVARLVDFSSPHAGFPASDPRFADRGLTHDGFDLLAEAGALGVRIDLAGLNDWGIEDALVASRAPCIVSEASCRAVHDVPHNLADRHLRGIAAAGGAIGLSLDPDRLGGGAQAFAEHAAHALRVAGADVLFLAPTVGARCLDPRIAARILERRGGSPARRYAAGSGGGSTRRSFWGLGATPSLLPRFPKEA